MLEMLKRNTGIEDLTLVGGSDSAFRIGHEDGTCTMDDEVCTGTKPNEEGIIKDVSEFHHEHESEPNKEKALRDKVIELYQRGVDFFTERANNAEKVMEEATKRGIRPEKLLKHMDKKYPYGRADFQARV